jgi:hypothetical protein
MIGHLKSEQAAIYLAIQKDIYIQSDTVLQVATITIVNLAYCSNITSSN